MADSKKYNGSTWEHSLRKLTTSTDTFTTLPADIYADGNNATVGLKGNTVQNGTPTPDNPIMPEGCGDLETVGAKAGQYKIPISSAGQTTPIYLGEVETTRTIKKLVFDGTENWQGVDSAASKYLQNSITDFKVVRGVTCMSTHYSGANNVLPGDAIPNNSACFNLDLGLQVLYLKGSEPITLADFKAYLAQQYANGTPVTVWYVLSEPATGIVNEPLMKIGDHADTVSGITIPTITSKDTFDVDTTLKPSEVSLSYTGWHDATVEEWDGSQWQ